MTVLMRLIQYFDLRYEREFMNLEKGFAKLEAKLSNAMQYTGDWVGLMAGVVIIMVPTTKVPTIKVPTIKMPTILLYTILSERMISSITMGSVKA